MRPGVRLAVDVGEVRIGIAACDPEGLLATPVVTLPADDGAVDRITGLVAEHGAVEVVVGLPVSLSGREGPAAAKARAFAGRLATSGIPVRLVDERLSTVSADAALRAGGGRGKAHGKRRRQVVDQAAAVVILQNALDVERTTGRPAGQPVHPAATSEQDQ